MPSRYQKEIEEILEQTGKTTPQLPATPRTKRRGPPGSRRSLVGRAFASLPFRVSPARLMIASIGILLAAAVLKAFNTPGVSPLFAVGIVLFIVAYTLFFLPSSRPRVEPRWRGRPVNYRTSWRQRLRRWFRL